MENKIQLVWNGLNNKYKRNKPFYLKNYDQFVKVMDLYSRGYSIKKIANLTNKEFSTIYRLIKEVRSTNDIKSYKEIEEESIFNLLELNGFTKIGSERTLRRIKKKVPNLEVVKINTGVGMEGRKYSSTSLFGLKPRTIAFLISNEDSFKFHVTKMIEGLFYERNPHPDSNLKKAFTHFLHSFGFSYTIDPKMFGRYDPSSFIKDRV